MGRWDARRRLPQTDGSIHSQFELGLAEIRKEFINSVAEEVGRRGLQEGELVVHIPPVAGTEREAKAEVADAPPY